MVGEPEENLLLGLENLPGDPGNNPLVTRGVEPDPSVLCMFRSAAFVRGPHFISNGSGLNGSRSIIGFCFTILSLAFSAAVTAFSLLNFISFHGSILTRKPCFLEKEDGLVSPSIFMDNLLGF